MQTIIVNRHIPLSPDVRACSGTAPDHVKRYAAADIRTFDVPLTELALHRNSIFLHADEFNSPCCIGVIFCRQTRMVLPLPFPSRPWKAKFSALPTSFLYKKRLFPAAGSNHGHDYTAAPHALPLPEYGGTAPCPSLRRSRMVRHEKHLFYAGGELLSALPHRKGVFMIRLYCSSSVQRGLMTSMLSSLDRPNVTEEHDDSHGTTPSYCRGGTSPRTRLTHMCLPVRQTMARLRTNQSAAMIRRQHDG